MIKRAFDFLMALLMLLLLSPLITLIALLVAIKLGRPVLFLQIRPGKKGRPFKMVKFRSMKGGVGADGKLLPDVERMTPFGRVLRSSSLDELPELWNVLKGEMSLVGPRPLLMEYLPLYSPEQARRHEICPGITGWAQINGRNSLSWEERFRLDVWYVDNRSFALDLRILTMTISRVLKRSGISEPGQETMSKFTGSQS